MITVGLSIGRPGQWYGGVLVVRSSVLILFPASRQSFAIERVHVHPMVQLGVAFEMQGLVEMLASEHEREERARIRDEAGRVDLVLASRRRVLGEFRVDPLGTSRGG